MRSIHRVFCVWRWRILLLSGLSGCGADFWSSYAINNPQACAELMAACAAQPDTCSAMAKREACGQAVHVSTDIFDPRPRKEVDILFLIDNSPSMSPKQKALAQNIPKFIQKIDDFGASYHIGIATSDIGTDRQPAQPWGGNIGKCDSYEGDDGLLQVAACDTRADVTSDAKNACSSLCPDDRFVPIDGHRFISKADGIANVPIAMERDPMSGKMIDRGPIHAFQCMALVGDSGCGVEGQLEGSRRALDGHRSENLGFLRKNSVLAVIYVTDEDDCSVQLAQRDQNNPVGRDCDPTQPDSFACYNLDYRCLARSIQCSETMLTPGVKTNCTERPNNYLEKLEQYHEFFTTLRPAAKLLVSGIWTLPSILNGGRLQIAGGSGGTGTQYLNRASGMGASCTYTGAPDISGQAQYRLSSFAKRFGTTDDGTPNAREFSICDIDNYPAALDNIASAIENRLQASCLSVKPQLVNNKPLCQVGDVDESTPASTPDSVFPVCSTKCCDAWASSNMPAPTTPSISSACAAETTDACYCAVKSSIGQCTGTVVAGVWRKGGAMSPPGKVVSFQCVGEPM